MQSSLHQLLESTIKGLCRGGLIFEDLGRRGHYVDCTDKMHVQEFGAPLEQ